MEARSCKLSGRQEKRYRTKCVLLLNVISLLTLYSIDTHFNASTTDSFDNIVGKEEIARFSFPTMFSTHSENCIPMCQYFRHHIFI